MKKLFLWTEIVAYIFWEDWQPGRDDPEKFAFFLFSDAGDFVPYSKILLLSLLFLAFSSASLEKTTTIRHILTCLYTLKPWNQNYLISMEYCSVYLMDKIQSHPTFFSRLRSWYTWHKKKEKKYSSLFVFEAQSPKKLRLHNVFYATQVLQYDYVDVSDTMFFKKRISWHL